jgi:hypothetical protein
MFTPKFYTMYAQPALPKILSDQPVTVSLSMDSIRLDDKAEFKVFHQLEPPEVADLTDVLIANHKHYNLILAWNTKVLDACPNARLFPLCCSSWIPWNDAGVNSNHARPPEGAPPHIECDASLKLFKASYLTSSKANTSGQRFRQEIFNALPDMVKDLEIIKHRSPPWISDKRIILERLQYTISPLNACHRNWMDDKIADPFIAKCIPFTWGCPNLSEYFNPRGFISFNSISELIEKLQSLTPEYYSEHYDAVIDNYHRAMKFTPIWTRIDKEIERSLGGIR